MCVVSNSGDYWGRRLTPWNPYIHPYQPFIPAPETTDVTTRIFKFKGDDGPSQEDFDRLKEEVEMMKDQLRQAKEYDEKNGEPDCEVEEKMKFLRRVAKSVGVELDDVLKPKTDDKSKEANERQKDPGMCG